MEKSKSKIIRYSNKNKIYLIIAHVISVNQNSLFNFFKKIILEQ